VNVSFTTTFGGSKIVYTAARDLQGNNSGWQAQGTFQVTSTSSGTIAIGSLSPGRGAAASGTGQTLTAVLTDSKGTGDFGVVNLLINSALDAKQAC
jgi:hypothetical protein